MLDRVLEPEAMDSLDEAITYDAMDHRAVNGRFVDDLLVALPNVRRVLDLGTGTAHIPIVLCARAYGVTVTALDLAPSMLKLAARNVAEAVLTSRISLVVADTKTLPFEAGDFDAVVSNSLVHHVARVEEFFTTLAKLAGERGGVFVRDLARPASINARDGLVEQYAAGESDVARELFRASLHAALTVDEVRALVGAAGLRGATVTMTSDRHWTLVRPAAEG